METDQHQTIIRPGLELTPFDADKEIQKFPIKIENLMALAQKYEGLTIKGLDDKEGYNAVVTARKEIKKVRVNIENTGKDVRDGAVKFQKMVIAKEKELVACIEPTEDRLLELERGWEELKGADEKEKERQKSARIQSMLERMNAVEYGIDIFDLQAMNDEQFTELLSKATADFEVIKAQRETQRLWDEANALIESNKKKEDAERLEKQRVEQEAERKQLEQDKAAIKAEQDRMAAEREQMEALQSKLQKERTSAREARLKAIGMFNSGIGMMFKHDHNPGNVLFGQAHILNLTDEGFDEQFEFISKHVDEFKQAGENNKKRKDEEAKAKKQREKELKKEKELRMSDGQRFTDLKSRLEVVFTYDKPEYGMQSAWGKLAAEKVETLVNEAIEVCKANEPTDGK